MVNFGGLALAELKQISLFPKIFYKSLFYEKKNPYTPLCKFIIRIKKMFGFSNFPLRFAGYVTTSFVALMLIFTYILGMIMAKSAGTPESIIANMSDSEKGILAFFIMVGFASFITEGMQVLFFRGLGKQDNIMYIKGKPKGYKTGDARTGKSNIVESKGGIFGWLFGKKRSHEEDLIEEIKHVGESAGEEPEVDFNHPEPVERKEKLTADDIKKKPEIKTSAPDADGDTDSDS